MKFKVAWAHVDQFSLVALLISCIGLLLCLFYFFLLFFFLYFSYSFFVSNLKFNSKENFEPWGGYHMKKKNVQWTFVFEILNKSLCCLMSHSCEEKKWIYYSFVSLKLYNIFALLFNLMCAHELFGRLLKICTRLTNRFNGTLKHCMNDLTRFDYCTNTLEPQLS